MIKNSILFLICQAILVFIMILMMPNMPLTMLAFVVSMWSYLIAIMYASIWREEIGCKCLIEKRNKDE